MIKLSDWDVGEPDMNPHFAMEVHWMILGPSFSFSVSPTSQGYEDKMENNVVNCIGSLVSSKSVIEIYWHIHKDNESVFIQLYKKY